MKLCLITAGALLALVVTGCLTSGDTAKGLGTGPSCETVPCGSGESMKVCTSSSPTGECSGVSYEVGGKTFSCGSCTNCEQAASQAAQVCSGGGGSVTAPFPDAGSSGSSDSGKVGLPDTGGGGGAAITCSTNIPCGANGATYAECTSTQGGSCSAITYETSDGQWFSCNGCADCTSAVEQLTSYCSGSTVDDAGGGGGGGGTTTCSSSVACGSDGATYQVCTTTDGTGACSQIAYDTSDGQTFDCSGCSDCSSAVQQITSYCAASSGGGQQCGNAVCGSAATCCNCSGTPVCYTFQPGESCTDINCSN